MGEETFEMGRGRPVSEESLAKKRRVVNLYQGKKPMSLGEIGEEVRLTRQRVLQILQEQGIEVDGKGRPSRSDEIERILELGEMSKADLAELLAVGPPMLSRWLHTDSGPGPSYQRRLKILLQALERAAISSKP